MDLTHVQRLGADGAWSVALPEEQGGGQAMFHDAEAGGVLPALLQALEWRSGQTGARRDWAWAEEGLERVDRAGTHGWWASVNLGTYLDADLFEDVEHGGTREALLAALSWRRRVARPGRQPPENAGGGGGGGGQRRGRGKGEKRGGGARPNPAPRRAGRKRPRRPNSRPPQG